jgi:hypothetical protein
LASFIAFVFTVVFVFFLVGFSITVIALYEVFRPDSDAGFVGLLIEVAL